MSTFHITLITINVIFLLVFGLYALKVLFCFKDRLNTAIKNNQHRQRRIEELREEMQRINTLSNSNKTRFRKEEPLRKD